MISNLLPVTGLGREKKKPICITFNSLRAPWISDEIWNPWSQSFDSPSLSDGEKKGGVELILLNSSQIFPQYSLIFLSFFLLVFELILSKSPCFSTVNPFFLPISPFFELILLNSFSLVFPSHHGIDPIFLISLGEGYDFNSKSEKGAVEKAIHQEHLTCE